MATGIGCQGGPMRSGLRSARLDDAMGMPRSRARLPRCPRAHPGHLRPGMAHPPRKEASACARGGVRCGQSRVRCAPMSRRLLPMVAVLLLSAACDRGETQPPPAASAAAPSASGAAAAPAKVSRADFNRFAIRHERAPLLGERPNGNGVPERDEVRTLLFYPTSDSVDFAKARDGLLAFDPAALPSGPRAGRGHAPQARRRRPRSGCPLRPLHRPSRELRARQDLLPAHARGSEVDRRDLRDDGGREGARPARARRRCREPEPLPPRLGTEMRRREDAEEPGVHGHSRAAPRPRTTPIPLRCRATRTSAPPCRSGPTRRPSSPTTSASSARRTASSSACPTPRRMPRR